MTNTATEFEPPHPPLARDAYGNCIAFPDGTAAWRICRQTTGRPREILGHDKQPLRFPLETTCDALVSMCGRDVYRVYALDDVGKQLDYVTTIDLSGDGRDLRNAGGAEPMLPVLRPSAAIATSTDLRFALEAMAQMMRTNSEALRTVTDAHVDLAKAIAVVRGLPRNASLYLPAAAAAANDEEDDDGEQDNEAPIPKNWVDLLLPAVEKLAEAVPGLLVGKAMQQQARAASAKALDAGTSEEDTELAKKPDWELRDFVDFAYASRKSKAKKAARDTQPGATSLASLQAKIMADSALMQHLMGIKAQLMTDEIQLLLGSIAQSSEAEQLRFLEKLKALSLENAVAICREVVTTLRADAASTEVSDGE